MSSMSDRSEQYHSSFFRRRKRPSGIEHEYAHAKRWRSSSWKFWGRGKTMACHILSKSLLRMKSVTHLQRRSPKWSAKYTCASADDLEAELCSFDMAMHNSVQSTSVVPILTNFVKRTRYTACVYSSYPAQRAGGTPLHFTAHHES
jgi:hypothetical protein